MTRLAHFVEQYYCILAILYREPFIHARAAFAQMQVSEAVEIQKTAARSIQDIVASLDVSILSQKRRAVEGRELTLGPV